MFRLMLPAVAATLALIATSSAEEPKSITLFNGKDLTGWKPRDEKKSKWQVSHVILDPKKPEALLEARTDSGDDQQAMVTIKPSCDIYTTEKFGDCHVEVEFMIPKGSNSGVYLMGEYEVQILDSYGKANDQLKPGDMGGIYTTAAPKVNASKKPGEWQKFVIDFQAPRFEGDKKTANGKFIKVVFNDQVIHENVEVKGSTGGGLTGKEAATGPLMFQGDHGPVAFRNVKITPRK
jgi:hypothetical protein